MVNTQRFDAIVIGAGFGGIYQTYALRKAGLSVRVLDKAESVGGTWHYNRFPGATSDTPSHLYRYSWDEEDLRSYKWSETYLTRDEVLSYLNHVIDKENLRPLIQFNTSVHAAEWQDAKNEWLIVSDRGQFEARYLITALGILSDPNWPEILGHEQFTGELYHTSRWPDNVTLRGKRVAVIGNGSTGVQVITAIAKDVGSLVCFQRHPQYTVPLPKHTVSKEDRDRINASYDDLWAQVRSSRGGIGVKESTVPAMSVSYEDREQIYEDGWKKGGMHFATGTFVDIASNEAANKTAADFVKKKIRQIVKDPEKARRLIPSEGYVRRPLSDLGYYEQFNRPNVDIVNTLHNPLKTFTKTGLELADSTTYEFDIIICATGFHAFDGAYRKIKFRGRDGLTLEKHWKEDPVSNLGVAIANFPNLFMVMGPKSPLANVPPVIETHVNFITGIVRHAETIRHQSRSNKIAIETTEDAEAEWNFLCEKLSEMLLFKQGASYFYGTPINGKRPVLIFYGGLAMLIEKLAEVTMAGYKGFKFQTVHQKPLLGRL